VIVHAAIVATLFASSTAYSETGLMANGHRTHPHAAASNTLKLGTHIRLLGASFYGIRTFTIEDTGSPAMQLDLWTSSEARAIKWGRKPVHYEVVR
jgi:3D (Asp-Asp-Asp) domain-containing protein